MPERRRAGTRRRASPRRERGRLNFDLDVDVCVIGGGLAGLTVAREVAERGWSVAVLEADRVAWAASGRNTGFVLPGFAEDVSDMIERVGLDHTKQLWALSEQRRRLCPPHHRGDRRCRASIRCPAGSHVSKTDNAGAQRAEVERLRWIGADVEFWPTERVREVLPNPRYFSAVHYRDAFHIHPLNYALGLAARRKKRARASSRTRRRWRSIRPACASASSRRRRGCAPTHVVLAGNVHLGALMPRLAATLLPVTTFVMVTEPIGQSCRGDPLSRRGQRRRARRQSLPHRRRQPAACGRAHAHLGGRPAALRARAHRATSAATFPALGEIEAAHRVARHARPHRAPHAADRRARARSVARERLRRPRAQHHGDGRRTDRARHRRGRPDLAAVRALRTGLGRRPARAALVQGVYWVRGAGNAGARRRWSRRARAAARAPRRTARPPAGNRLKQKCHTFNRLAGDSLNELTGTRAFISRRRVSKCGDVLDAAACARPE